MTRERCKELLPVMTAWANGEVIQCRCRHKNGSYGAWEDLRGTGAGDDPHWCSDLDYRVKPKPLEVWLVLDAADHIMCARSDAQDAFDRKPTHGRVVRMREVVE